VPDLDVTLAPALAPDDLIGLELHWRDSRLEWPIRHGFADLILREFSAGKMMFPPDAS